MCVCRVPLTVWEISKVKMTESFLCGSRSTMMCVNYLFKNGEWRGENVWL